MKFCGKCGTKLEDDAKFCASCGEPCSITPKMSAARKHKRKSKVPFIGGAIVLIVFLIVGLTVFRWYNSPEQQAIRALSVNDYATAQDIVTRNRTILYSDTLENKLSNRIDELTSGYKNESLEYETIITELEIIEKLGIPGIADQLTISKQFIENLHSERSHSIIYALAKETSFHSYKKTNEVLYSYDDQGKLIQIDIDNDAQEVWNEELDVYEYSTFADGNINHSMRFEYDDNGNVVKMSKTHPQHNIDSPEEYYEYRYEYDKNGNINTCTEYWNGTLSPRAYICKFKWDNGLLIEEDLSSTDSMEINIGTYCYMYDDNGRVTTYTISEDGDVYVVNLSYNGSDKVEKANIQLKGHSYELNSTYSYDSQGNYIPDVETKIEHIEYDEYGNISVIQYEKGYYIQYEYQKMLVSSDLIWNGSTVAAIRQFDDTQDPNQIVPGQNHVSCIYALS